MENASEKTFSFGNFELDAGRRRLLKEGEIIALNSKSFDLLLTLVENHGQILSKDELLEKVWEGQFVEENNLTVHISALRKIFGEKKNEHRFIATVPGKGYKFVAEIREANGEKALPVRAELPASGFYEAETLVGREREIAEIINLLRGDAANLITLTGAGGTGKTRIARAIGSEAAADFPDGVFFVELAAVTDAELVAAAIASALGVKESGGAELVETLKNFLRERRTLLILDNFEQLLSAAPVVSEISAAAPLLKILTTSRAALAIKNEREFAVMPLAVPPREAVISADKLAGYAAAALFIRRAQSAKPNFVLREENAPIVAEICHRLDGLPLAIELAAARTKLLSPQAILDRLENSLKLLTSGDENLPSRQRTMRETIQWSYDLLGADEKALFRRLAVFVGGFSIEAAESVVGGAERWSVVGGQEENSDQQENSKTEDRRPKTGNQNLTDPLSRRRPPTTVLDIITSLIDSNLLAQIEQTDGASRLRMLEVVREFAAERLDASGELDELQKNHAGYFLALAEEAEPFLLGETAAKWLEKLETEHDNLRAALRWSLENDNESLIRLAAALRRFWSYHSHLSEGLGWLKAALKATDNRISEARFKLLAATGVFLRNLGDVENAREIYEKILAEAEEIGDLAQIINANHGLSANALLQEDYAAAQKFLEEALQVSRQIGDDSTLASTLCALGNLEMSKENLRAARPFLEESLTLSKKLGNRHLLNTAYLNLGTIDYLENSWNEAAFNFAESLRIARENGNKMLVSCSLDGFAALAAAGGNYAQSAKIAGAAENLREATGYEPEPAEKIFREKYLARTRAALAPKDFIDAYESGRSLDFSQSIALTEATEFDFAAAFDENTSEIIIENRRISRIVIEESEEKGRTEVEEKRRFLGFLPFSFSPFLLFFFILAAIGGYLWLNRQTLFSSAAPFARNSIRQLTTNGKVGLAAISPDGKLFAYTIDDTGQKSLWLGFVNGGNHLPLRPAAAAVYRTLAFAPDSNHLYFSVLDEQNPKSALYKMPVSGGVPVKILDEIGHFALSPDGKRIAIARRDAAAGRDFLVVAALDGSERRDAASFPKEFSFYFETISWSADGKRFAVSAIKDSKIYQHELAVVSAATGETERISPPELREINKTAWLADGSGLIVTAVEHGSHASVPQYLIYHVAYPSGETSAITADRSNYGASWHNDAGASLGVSAANDLLLAVEHRQLSNVWVAPTDNLSAARQITFSSFGKYDGLWGLDWTPDGRLIYTTSDTRSQYLSKMNDDGGEQQSLTAPGAVDSLLSVSSDGRYVFFQSNRGGDYDVWRMDTDGANMKQLTFGGKAFHPAPAPDGRWVYYKSGLKNIGELCRVPVDGGETECLNDKSTSWGSFSPDGKFFAAAYVTDKQRLAIFSAETNALVKQFDLPKGGTLYMGSRWSPDSLAVVYRDTAFGYWKQPVEGGEPTRLEGLPKEKFYNFAFSKDGRQFAFVRGTEIRDVVLITNDK